mgnify:CR=1 FL=1|jgi:hypothetical protein|tara:strand:+ start:81 stop:878 length:798 start_codon:yes stop_codon:yes gene_type:complete
MHWNRNAKVPASAIVWRGQSAFDGKPIVAIVTGLDRRSKNPKTGANLAQLWILRSDISPLDAIKTGEDQSICWICKHRGDGTGKARSCYVAVKNAPLVVYRSYRKGRYVTMSPSDVATHLASQSMGIRIGAYGDGAALPINVIADLTHGIFHTGYTHAWKSRPDLKPWLMASVDTPTEYAMAKRSGWRTFRVRTSDEHLDPREIACPASDESGKRTSCDHCGLCDGARHDDQRKSIAIIAHGTGTSSYVSLRSLSVITPRDTVTL